MKYNRTCRTVLCFTVLTVLAALLLCLNLMTGSSGVSFGDVRELLLDFADAALRELSVMLEGLGRPAQKGKKI